MATEKSGNTDTKTSRCWPGYEPVPGKSEHEEGSCRKKPASRNGGKEPDRETSRQKQIARGGKRAEQAKAKAPRADERKSTSKSAKKSAAQKSSAKTAAKTTSAKSAKRANAKKSAA